jgi:hypothetical protein
VKEKRMPRILNGLVAGFVATIITSLVLIGGTRSELLARVDPVTELTAAVNKYQIGPIAPQVGWALYFVIGTVVLGTLYARFRPLFGSGAVFSGVIFGALVWTAEVVFLQPVTGVGLLAHGLPAGATEGAAALFLNLVYGVVLGIVYANLRSTAATRQAVPG